MCGFWNVFLTTQNVSLLPERENLVIFFCDLFKGSPELCRQFWLMGKYT
jgi:hypothetical protein